MLRCNNSPHKASTRMIFSFVVARRPEFIRTGVPIGSGAGQDEQRGSARESVTLNRELKIPMKAKYVLKQLSVNMFTPLALAGVLREVVTKTLVRSRAFGTHTLTINN